MLLPLKTELEKLCYTCHSPKRKAVPIINTRTKLVFQKLNYSQSLFLANKVAFERSSTSINMLQLQQSISS